MGVLYINYFNTSINLQTFNIIQRSRVMIYEQNDNHAKNLIFIIVLLFDIFLPCLIIEVEW